MDKHFDYILMPPITEFYVFSVFGMTLESLYGPEGCFLCSRVQLPPPNQLTLLPALPPMF